MNVITIGPGDEWAKEVFNENKLTLSAEFLRDNSDPRKRKVKEIKVTLDNQDTQNNAYDLDSLHLCEFSFKKSFDLHILEINLREVPEEAPVPSSKSKSFRPNNFKIEKGTIIYVLIHIYDIGEQIKNCDDSNWNQHPRTKKGNIIVGNP